MIERAAFHDSPVDQICRRLKNDFEIAEIEGRRTLVVRVHPSTRNTCATGQMDWRPVRDSAYILYQTVQKRLSGNPAVRNSCAAIRPGVGRFRHAARAVGRRFTRGDFAGWIAHLDSATRIIEKPEVPPSSFAVTGLYFLDGTAPERARAVEPSTRGELEITTLLESYLDEGVLAVERMGRGYAWLDTGTHASLLDASNFVRTLTERQGLQTGSPDEIAYAKGWIDSTALEKRAEIFRKTDYGRYLVDLPAGKKG